MLYVYNPGTVTLFTKWFPSLHPHDMERENLVDHQWDNQTIELHLHVRVFRRTCMYLLYMYSTLCFGHFPSPSLSTESHWTPTLMLWFKIWSQLFQWLKVKLDMSTSCSLRLNANWNAFLYTVHVVLASQKVYVHYKNACTCTCTVHVHVITCIHCMSVHVQCLYRTCYC